MSWAQVNWKSEILGKQTTMQVLLPTAGQPPYATFYLLHGLSDDATIWLRQTRIEAYVRALPLIVIMPDGYRGFYTDNENGPDYARHFGAELPAFVERNFQARPARSARAIGGLSMGGYGALRIALEYPEKFCSVNSHSGALLRSDIDLYSPRTREEPLFKGQPPAFFRELERLFGRHPQGTKHDLFALIRRARRRQQRLPRLLLDCGTEDFLLPYNREFHAQLEKMDVPHLYREFPGAHNWDYWDLHIREALAFHARNLRLPEDPLR